MLNLRNLPVGERPRERLIKYGAEALSLPELIAIIFSRGTKENPVMIISQMLLSKFGSLELLLEASIEDLININGIGLTKACQLKASIELAKRINEIPTAKSEDKNISPEDIYKIIRSKITNYFKEYLLVVSLNSRNDVIAVDTVSVGTLNSGLIHPRETFETAIKRHAAQIIICHNHPSNILSPSKDDLLITKNLYQLGKIMGIEIIDHLIIGKNGFFSFKQEGIIF